MYSVDMVVMENRVYTVSKACLRGTRVGGQGVQGRGAPELGSSRLVPAGTPIFQSSGSGSN